MSVKFMIVTVISAFLIAGTASARTPSPEGAQVYIISPVDGEMI